MRLRKLRKAEPMLVDPYFDVTSAATPPVDDNYWQWGGSYGSRSEDRAEAARQERQAARFKAEQDAKAAGATDGYVVTPQQIDAANLL